MQQQIKFTKSNPKIGIQHWRIDIENQHQHRDRNPKSSYEAEFKIKINVRAKIAKTNSAHRVEHKSTSTKFGLQNLVHKIKNYYCYTICKNK